MPLNADTSFWYFKSLINYLPNYYFRLTVSLKCHKITLKCAIVNKVKSVRFTPVFVILFSLWYLDHLHCLYFRSQQFVEKQTAPCVVCFLNPEVIVATCWPMKSGTQWRPDFHILEQQIVRAIGTYHIFNKKWFNHELLLIWNCLFCVCPALFWRQIP